MWGSNLVVKVVATSRNGLQASAPAANASNHVTPALHRTHAWRVRCNVASKHRPEEHIGILRCPPAQADY
jgi:hypothetical protein